MGSSTARSVPHPLFARFWAAASPRLDAHGGGDIADRLLAGLSGRAVEIGAGTGRLFPHYPDGTREVVAVEPEPYLRGRARAAARSARVPVAVVEGSAEALPLADGSCQAAVASLVLCSVADLPGALAEIRRVLEPGGRLRFFEHVVAEGHAHRRLQQLLDATVWPRVGAGCHTARDTLAAIEHAGFTLASAERFRFPGGRMPAPTSPHILGEALVTMNGREPVRPATPLE